MKATVTYIGTHADTLDDGRPVAPGERVEGVDLELPHNKLLHDEGHLIVVEEKQTRRRAPKEEDE